LVSTRILYNGIKDILNEYSNTLPDLPL